MKTAKLGAIFLVAIMAFTGIGAAYAHWEQTLTIGGVMKTDNIDPKFECDKSNDDPQDTALATRLDPNQCGTWSVGGGSWTGSGVERRNKDVGSMDTHIEADGKTITITIGDAYPCYYSHAYWCTKNYGSVPVKIHSLKLTQLSIDETPATPEGNIVKAVDVTLTSGTPVYVDWYIDGSGNWQVYTFVGTPTNPQDYDFMITPTGTFTIGAQLDPYAWNSNPGQHMASGYTNQLDHDLCIHFENGCRQLYKYDFTIGLCFYNWPE